MTSQRPITSSVPYEIRRGTLADLPEVQRLNAALFDFEQSQGYYLDDSFDIKWPYSPAGEKYFTDFLSGSDPTKALFVAAVTDATPSPTAPSSRAAGYLAAAYYDRPYRIPQRIAHLENIFIEPHCRRRGIGAQLITAFKTWAREQQVGRLRVEAFTPNHPAIAFYHRHGFVDFEVVLEQPLNSS